MQNNKWTATIVVVYKTNDTSNKYACIHANNCIYFVQLLTSRKL